MTLAGDRRAWVVTECYPRPKKPTHCIFAHRQLTGVRSSGWLVNVLVPNGWYPPLVWPVARAWRLARKASITRGFHADSIPVADLTHQNRVPSRLSRPREYIELVAHALDRRLDRAQTRRDRDLLVVQFALPYGPAVRRVAARRGLHYAVHLRGDDVWIWPHTHKDGIRTFADTVRGASLVLSVSEALLEEARRLVGDELPQGAVVPNGIDLDRFHPPGVEERNTARQKLGISSSDVAVLCVGTALARKGWPELLSALGNLGRDDVLLLAACSGQGDLDIRAERDRKASRVRLIDRYDIDAEELRTLYFAADVFCLPSHGEGMSNAVLEALACGLPVVTTPVGGHREVIDDGIEGVFTPVGDVSALMGVLRDLLDDPERRAAMGTAASRRARAIGTPATNGGRVAALFDAVLEGTRVSNLVDGSPYAMRERV